VGVNVMGVRLPERPGKTQIKRDYANAAESIFQKKKKLFDFVEKLDRRHNECKCVRRDEPEG
jgi:hypothetical protein